MASYHFNEIELEEECDPDPYFCDPIPNFESMMTHVSLPNLDPFSELTLIPVLIDFEIEPPILESHIPLMGRQFEFQLFNFDSILEPKLIFETKLNLSHIPESVLIPFLSF